MRAISEENVEVLRDQFVAVNERGFPRAVPPSPETSQALPAPFVEREIAFIPGVGISSLDPERRVAVLDDGGEMP